jgi:hypothetical protein
MVGVNGRKGIAIPGNFLFGAVPGCCLTFDELFDAFDRRLNSFDAVGGFGTLDNGHLAQRLEHLRCLLDKQRFFPPVLTQQADRPQERMGYRLSFQQISFE